MIINVWIALSDTARAEVASLYNDPGNYSGVLTDDEQTMLLWMQDRKSRISLFKSPTIATRNYTLYTIDFDTERVPLQRVIDTVDGLTTKYPNQVVVGGAWRVDNGRQAGATYDAGGNKTADGPYPVHPQLWQFMPDEIGATSNADLTDVNILFGQSPRDFS